MVELMVQLRMSFASVHHFLEGKKGRDSKNEPMTNGEKKIYRVGPMYGQAEEWVGGCGDAATTGVKRGRC